MISKQHLFSVLTLSVLISLTSCVSDDSSMVPLTEEQKHLPENALQGLEVADGLQLQLMAAEPVLMDPTNIDVDDRGRIWVAEAFNYRPFRQSTTIPEGDRIMILEDKDGDGVAENSKVFYQGPEINAPLGICVLPDRVIVSQSPFVWAFYDDNGDDKADRKEIIFQGIHGEQHDHGMHAFVAGPDGKLYFNFGNEGKSLRDKNNQVVLDQYGDSINSPKYKQGMVFRCDPDGSNVERLGYNFRNNYEVAVDSYGTMWQSDNDDDGNRGVRINYVMDYGNYGYTDEITGAGWPAKRINMEDSIPLRHWHLNDPGVVPNLLQTGSGSPTGIIVYEGSLLPEKFHNQMIHCEPGHNVVRAYPVKKDGAGYTATIENILKGENDQWFRPSDVCVAPDGSLIVADWYDPVVGGHAADDKESGRIYRVAPKGSKYKIPEFDYTTAEGAVSALQNPNLAVRRNAWVGIQKMGAKAVPALEELWKSSANDRMRARAFWALVKLPGGEKYIAAGIKDNNSDLRITALRAARELNANVLGVVGELVNDKDPQVRRECALALHFNKSSEAPALWATLAAQYDGKDRWYLEALGIGADEQWDAFFEAYLQKVPDPLQTDAGRDIVWRSRSTKSLPYLSKLAADESVSEGSRLRYFRAFHFNPAPAATNALLQIIKDNKADNSKLNALVLQCLNSKVIQNSSVARSALNKVLKDTYGSNTYFDLIKQYEVKSQVPDLLKFVLDKPEDELAPEALKLVVQYDGKGRLAKILKGSDEDQAANLLTAMGRVGNRETIEILQEVMLGKEYDGSLRVMAAGMLGRSYSGQDAVFNLVKANKIPEELMPPVMVGVGLGPRKNMRSQIEKYLASGPESEEKKPFDKQGVLDTKGDITKGLTIFKTNCAICHQVKGEGTDFGPKLSEIGSKLPKDGLLESIINPSAGVSFGYETTELNMKDGSTLTGLLTSKSATEIELKLPGGTSQKVNIGDIKTMKKLPGSLMPDLHEALSKQDLADLLAYLSSLKK